LLSRFAPEVLLIYGADKKNSKPLQLIAYKTMLYKKILLTTANLMLLKKIDE